MANRKPADRTIFAFTYTRMTALIHVHIFIHRRWSDEERLGRDPLESSLEMYPILAHSGHLLCFLLDHNGWSLRSHALEPRGLETIQHII